MAGYSIEARSVRIPPLYLVAHNYWILREAGTKGRDGIIAELHGMAYDTQKQRFVSVGYNEKNHRLHGLHSVHNYRYYSELSKDLVTFGPNEGFSLYKDGQKSQIVLTGGDEVKQRWLQAVKAAKMLTEKNLKYPALGIKGAPETVINSNSAYRTFGEIMSVDVINFRWTAEPGLRNSFLDKAQLQKLRFNDPKRCITTPFIKPGETFQPPASLRQSPTYPQQSPAYPQQSPARQQNYEGTSKDRLPNAYEVAAAVHKSIGEKFRQQQQQQQQRETEQSLG